MIKYLINRPIAVFMTFTALFILGLITYMNLPVSLLPDIPIPEISVHISAKDYSARELENTVVTPVRQQLLQVGKITDITSQTRDGIGIIRITFEYGTDTGLAFIEVNEKIDAAMGSIPKEIARPKVVKASATDIPVFHLNLTLKQEQEREEDFIELSEFAETVIRRRIEQLPQISMVDMTGLVHKQVLITPDINKLKVTGITLSDIESALSENNFEPGNMVVREGHYEYSIKFMTVMRTVKDIQEVYLRKNDKIYQLKNLAEIKLISQQETGMVYYNGKRAISLAVIKQADRNMEELREELANLISSLKNDYPVVDFTISQNQTELLDNTIANLKQNLILAFLFICLVSAFFMGEVKSPVIIGISIFISLIISLLFFYLCKVSLNIISLTGLILASGMMIDNSIIVTDNIGQYRRKGKTLDEACILGTNEIIAPMLSSSLTTIAVFVPLIFFSGIAGALFFDQAFSITIGLLVSYITGILLLPVLYKLFYSFKPFNKRIKVRKDNSENKSKPTNTIPLHEKYYHKGIEWIFSHKVLTVSLIIGIVPLCFIFFLIIRKDKMPEISQSELIVKIDWNENIHVDENKNRILNLMNTIEKYITESSALVGEQQYLLDKNPLQSASESQLYLKAGDMKQIASLQQKIENYFEEYYPVATIDFSPANTIFEQIFTTGAPDLVIEYYYKNGTSEYNSTTIKDITTDIIEKTQEKPVSISFNQRLNLKFDKQKMILYNVSYNDIYQAIKTAFKENNFTVLRSYDQYLPIILGEEEKNFYDLLTTTMIYTSTDNEGRRNSIPLNSFVESSLSEDVKSITAGKNGEYIPFYFYLTDKPETVIKSLKETGNSEWDINFSGAFFSNKKMISELVIILFISLLLMYFILAAQFEDFIQPLIVLIEIPIDITAALGLLIICGHTLNLMSAIGIIVTCGIIINDSILKIDMINQLRKNGMPLMKAIHEAGRRRLNAILLTSLTTIVCMVPLLFSHDMGSELEKPLAIATIGGMVIGTPVSLFIIPLIYWLIYHKKEKTQIH